MESSVKISVCVPVYGVEKYIERCARSLFEQTLKDGVEFIFVNDCTKDNSIEILRQVSADYPARLPQIRIVEHEHNRGLSAARNTALENAAGEFVYHIDSDDFLKPDTLEKLLDTAQKYNADFVAAGMYIKYDDHEEYPANLFYENKTDYLLDMLTRKITCNVCNNLIKRSLYQQNNIQAPCNINMGEDLSVTPKLVYFAQKIAFCPEPLYCYYRSNAGSYCNTPSLKNLQDITHVYNLLNDFFSDKVSPELLSAVRKGNFVVMLECAVTSLEHLKWLKKNFRCRIWQIEKNKSLKLKIANILFQLGWLRSIVWGTNLLRHLRSLKKQ